jgi:hypothetical protein
VKGCSSVLFFALLSLASAQQGGISGSAVDVLDQRTLSGVHIRLVLELPGVPPVAYGAMSNAAGHFSIDTVPPGTYSLLGERAGFTYRGPAMITLKTGELVSNLKLEFTPEAVISGRLLDPDGGPIPGIAVEAAPAGPSLDPIPGTTDDRGAFRLRGAPGKYRLRAQPRGGGFFVGIRASQSDDDPKADYVTTYYPSSPTEQGAVVLDAAPGQELSGNEIRLLRQHSLTISGVITGLGEAAEPTMVFARSEGRSFQVGYRLAEAWDGKFKLWRFQPGEYRVTARCLARKLRSRTISVRVDNADVTGIELALVAGDELTGTLQMPGERKDLTVLLEPERAQTDEVLERARGEVDKDGAFRIPDLFPGKYRVSVEPLPDNAYIAETKLNSAVVAGSLDLSGGVRGSTLKVTVRTDGGQISGTVAASNGERLTNTPAMVFLASPADDSTAEFKAWITPDGRYAISGIRPGKYRLFAIEEPPGMDLTTDVRVRVPAGAQEVTVPAGSRITKDVQLPREVKGDAKP